MKNLIYILSLFLCSIAVAQEEPDSHVFNTGLGIGQEFNFGKRQVKFKEVLSDSRCPREVTCIWAGNATVLLQIFSGEELVEEKQVVVPASGSSSLFIAGELSVEAIALLPYPDTSSDTSSRDYCLQLRLTQEQE